MVTLILTKLARIIPYRNTKQPGLLSHHLAATPQDQQDPLNEATLVCDHAYFSGTSPPWTESSDPWLKAKVSPKDPGTTQGTIIFHPGNGTFESMIFLFPKVGHVRSKEGMYLGKMLQFEGRHFDLVVRKLTSLRIQVEIGNHQGPEVGLGRCVCVCANGVVASHHQRAARRPAAAPEKKTFRGLKSFLSKKTLRDFEFFFPSSGALR